MQINNRKPAAKLITILYDFVYFILYQNHHFLYNKDINYTNGGRNLWDRITQQTNGGRKS